MNKMTMLLTVNPLFTILILGFLAAFTSQFTSRLAVRYYKINSLLGILFLLIPSIILIALHIHLSFLKKFRYYVNIRIQSMKSLNENLVDLISIIPIIGPIIMSIRLYYLLVDIKKRVEKGEIKLD